MCHNHKILLLKSLIGGSGQHTCFRQCVPTFRRFPSNGIFRNMQLKCTLHTWYCSHIATHKQWDHNSFFWTGCLKKNQTSSRLRCKTTNCFCSLWDLPSKISTPTSKLTTSALLHASRALKRMSLGENCQAADNSVTLERVANFYQSTAGLSIRGENLHA